MNLDFVFAIIFYGLLLLFFFTHRSKFELQNGIFALYKTKLGLNLMDKCAKISPRVIKFFGVIGIYVGFLGMIAMVYFLVVGAITVIRGGPPVLSPVLPGIELAPGIPKLGFWHWVISIFIVAVIHEFAHGIYARLYGIKVKSSGFAFLGPILAAFVEPDEKQMEKKSRKAQLSVFAAGPFFNIVLGIIFLLLTGFVVGPLVFSTLDFNGVVVEGFNEDSTLTDTGIKIGDVITHINNIEILGSDSISLIMKDVKPGDNVLIKTDKNEYNVITKENPNFRGSPYLGLVFGSKGFKQEYLDKFGELALRFFFWIYLLFWWIYTISLGIGIFNLVPLGPVDGGRMLYSTLTKFMKIELAKKIWSRVSIFILILIGINLLPWIIKLLLFIASPFIG